MRRPFVIAALLAAAHVAPATSDILRSCRASIEVQTSGKPAVVLAYLTGQGPCKNKANADKCRERARAELDECLDIVWADHRFDGALPLQCADMTSARRGARMAWEGIRLYEPPRSLFREAIHEVCCVQAPNKSSVTFHLGGSIWGGPGCAKSIGNDMTQSDFTFVSGFGVDCNHWRDDEGICDRP
ncbi:hypothetical protein [Rhodobacter sp. SY28-1]|uniref:hypothetical protein n=1 Tax=Rhodobacter sp. SY28-1 TaxID=2562317 RepID=UPI0010C0A04E|nr:hypothetical protein [Rhodobacter sp. SY28-1]